MCVYTIKRAFIFLLLPSTCASSRLSQLAVHYLVSVQSINLFLTWCRHSPWLTNKRVWPMTSRARFCYRNRCVLRQFPCVWHTFDLIQSFNLFIDVDKFTLMNNTTSNGRIQWDRFSGIVTCLDQYQNELDEMLVDRVRCLFVIIDRTWHCFCQRWNESHQEHVRQRIKRTAQRVVSIIPLIVLCRICWCAIDHSAAGATCRQHMSHTACRLGHVRTTARIAAIP
jgi:hypothetical protein